MTHMGELRGGHPLREAMPTMDGHPLVWVMLTSYSNICQQIFFC